MDTPTQAIQHLIEEIEAVVVPQDLSKRASLWKMAHAGEIVGHKIILRAIALYDLFESPELIPDLYKQHGHIVSGPDGDRKVTHLMALLSLQQIANFFGY